MLLTMGVRDCPEQAEVYAEVIGVVKSRFVLSHSFELLRVTALLNITFRLFGQLGSCSSGEGILRRCVWSG